MSTKPTILAFSPIFLETLDDTYNFVIFPYTIEENPMQTVQNALSYLKRHKIHIDAVIGLRDEESILAALIAKELRLAGPDPRSLFLAQHKAYFTHYAKKVDPNYPKTILIDTLPVPQNIPFPGFLKPVKSLASGYSYIIHNRNELDRSLTLIHEAPRPFLTWYDAFFRSQHTNETAYTPLTACLYQPFLTFDQYTVDLYIYKGEIQQHGVTKSIYTPDRKSFGRFDFPTALEKTVQDELSRILSCLMKEIGYDNAACNVEFFITDSKHISLIELNTRISGGFIHLFKKRLGISNLEMAIQIALGQKPKPVSDATKKLVSSYPLRTSVDKKVAFVPDKTHFDNLMKKLDVLRIHPTVHAGRKLSDYTNDAYSYRYAFVDIAGDTMPEIENKLEEVKKNLGIIFDVV